MTVLEHAQATSFDVGSNLKGRPLAAAWTYLLPTLRPGRVSVRGRPAHADLARVAELADEVGLLDQHSTAKRDLPANVRPVDRIRSGDVLWLAGDVRDVRAAAAEAAAARTVWAEGGRTRDILESSGRSSATFMLRPRNGAVVSIVPRAAPSPAAWLGRRGLLAPPMEIAVPGPARRAVERLAGAAVRKADLGERLGRLAVEAGVAPDALPGYVREFGHAAGLDLRTADWAFAAPGAYRTQKVLFLVGEAGADQPSLVVKLARDRSVSWRLRQSVEGLRSLDRLGLAAPGRAPRILFAAEEAGVAVVGEEALAGERATGARLARGAAADAAEWLTVVGERSARPAAGEDVVRVLGSLLERFLALHPADAALAAVLRAQLVRLAAEESIPIVFQHGDPGTWNLLVDDSGRVAFLDWENAEPNGLPLWDLFYFLRSYAMTSVPRRPGERRLAHARRAFLGRSAASRFVVEAIHEYCRRVGVPRGQVEPLYHLGWMFQALKETTRMRPGRLDDGHWIRFLRLGIAERSSPTLTELFGEDHR